MNTLFENPLPIYALGIVLGTFCGLAFLARRNLPALLSFVGIVLFTLLMIVVERVVVTEGEEVESTTIDLMGSLEKNDLPGVLAHIAPAATRVRSEAEVLMPLVQIKDTGAGSIQVEVDTSLQPFQAQSEFQAKVDGIHTRSGVRLFYFDRVQVTWTKQADRWLLTDYVPLDNGRPISAVESLRNKQPVTR
ncbi:MAG: hypothetical protein CMJ72_11505 [Planctomycetaceae bacterium]|nr:hypothetical protein [Planctomycetaceae bacterium]HCK41669.1 hypothetical protein [Planctomycetaceae bacterium]